ncbi:MAG TPA: glycosyl hydrolase 53 family protein, partial [Ferruginibacter sp.]|nr:glycosyl hydrolase 53 family protein [Ferruginibacter sp.]
MKYMTGIVLILLLNTGMMACKKSSDTTTTLPPSDTIPFAKGADVGWITEMEAAGVRFYNSSGSQQEGMALLKSLGMNTIRLRAWVNPSPSWNNTNDVVAKAVRAKNLGMRVMIDFHYSDTWADPGSQTKPAAWSSLDFTSLKT